MTNNEIIKYLESLLDKMRSYDSSQASIGKGFVEDIISMYYRQKSKIAVLSVENANLKICVEDLNAELENKNVELVGMRGACESYKMHYDNAQAEVEELQTKNKKYKAILEAINDETNPLPFETDFDKAINKAKSEAIRGFAERLENSEYGHYDWGNKDFVYTESDIDNILKEMVGDGDA